MTRCDILILHGNGWRVVDAALRAMAAGTLVIGLHAPDIEEIVQHGANGWSIDRDEQVHLGTLLLEITGLSPKGWQQCG